MTATWVNFALFLSLIVYSLAYRLRAAITQFVQKRHQDICSELENAQLQLEDSQKKYYDVLSQVDSMHSDIEKLRQQMNTQKQMICQNVEKQTQELSKRMIETARQNTTSLIRESKRELYYECLSQVFKQSKQTLEKQLSAQVRAQLQEEFLEEVECLTCP